MSNHTPGPWNKRAIRLLLSFSRKNGGPWDDEAIWPEDDSMNMPDENDARLIAAAPEMLASIKLAADLIRTANPKSAMMILDEMYAKAKGQSEQTDKA